MKENLVGVITGDIVASQKIHSEDYDCMLYTLERTLTMLKGSRNMKFETYRGDAFQSVFVEPVEAIYSAVIIRLALKATTPSFDVRQSVGIGAVTSIRGDIATSTGEVFTLSGKGLDTIKNDLIKVSSNNLAFQSKVGVLTKFLDAHLSGLTGIQSETLLCYLTSKDKSHAALAESLNKTRSNTTKLLIASRYQLVEEYLNYVKLCVSEEFKHV
ncbi:MAG: hypothetical protein ABJK64_14560 [Paraglaciecola sp.]|uniref:hypothetical protein n=1 Tax=Paraglaciecola sp. TaxID=1920173 RepID=UPI00329750B4